MLLLNILTNTNVDVLLNRLEIDNIEQLRFIEKKLATMKSGQVGEDRLARVFQHYQFPFPYQVLRGVSLDMGGKFQTDCLVLTPNLILLLESKNISGKLYFEKNPERLVRDRNDGQTADVYESPEVQVERNVILLKRWLEERGLKIPVVGAMVFTSAIHPFIIKGPERIPALFPKTVFSYVHHQWNEYRNRTQYLSVKDLGRLSEQIRAESVKNRYKQYPFRSSWKLDVKLINGVRCGICGRIGMVRRYGCWECSCGQKDKDAHIYTLQEWFMFNKETITNSECREFLMIDDRHLAKRLLKHGDILEFSYHRGTYYKWNW